MRATNLFGELEPETISMAEAASEAGVSVATIRNWIKTGYLRPAQNSSIEKSSLDLFMDNVAGTEKLCIRANKQFRDTHHHGELSDRIAAKIKTENGADLGEDYEHSLSNAYRNKEGIYYTPQWITKDMLTNLVGPLAGKTFLDPCCGSGNFLIEAIERGFSPDHVHGIDLDPNAVAIAKKRVFERTGHLSDNIRVGDFLELATQNNIPQFDHVFTNPPWGKKLAKADRLRYGQLLNAGKSTDTSSLFLLGGLTILKEDGILGYLLPGSFFNIATFENVRRTILGHSIHLINDYGKPFTSLLTDAQALVVRKGLRPEEEGPIECGNAQGLKKRTSASFRSNPRAILNFWASEEESTVIRHAYSRPHLTLRDRAQWGLGIVTGNNTKFIRSEPAEGLMPVFRGADIGLNTIKPPRSFIPCDLSLYQQVAPKALYEAPEKLIYKFISSHLRFHVDREQRYVLNSANMFVLEKAFPITADQLCDLLNSRFLNWFFKSMFKTAKVLRSDLETLPLHVDFFKDHDHFDESAYVEHLGIELTADGTYRIKG